MDNKEVIAVIENELATMYSAFMAINVQFKATPVFVFGSLPDELDYHAHTFDLSNGTKIMTSDPSLDCEDDKNGGMIVSVDLYIIVGSK